MMEEFLEGKLMKENKFVVENDAQALTPSLPSFIVYAIYERSLIQT